MSADKKGLKFEMLKCLKLLKAKKAGLLYLSLFALFA
jgi:hypothetical protein